MALKSSSQTPTVFVTGATGNIGGAVATLLRRHYGWAVKSTVRDTDSRRANALSALGVQLFPGDWDDVPSLVAAMTGCDKLFLCTTTHLEDPGLEQMHAISIVHAAQSAGCIRQVLACTSLGLFTYHGVDNTWQSTSIGKVMTPKSVAERAVTEKVKWNWTLLRPNIFRTNFFEPEVYYFSPGFPTTGVWRATMTIESPFALVPPEYIAKIAVKVFECPEKYYGRVLGVASDVLAVQDTLGQFEGEKNRSYTPYFMSDDEIKQKNEC